MSVSSNCNFNISNLFCFLKITPINIFQRSKIKLISEYWGSLSLFKWANTGLFFIFLRLFNKILQFYYISIWKCPPNIWRRDLNSQPSDYESPPLTTRPGLPSISCSVRYIITFWQKYFFSVDRDGPWANPITTAFEAVPWTTHPTFVLWMFLQYFANDSNTNV